MKLHEIHVIVGLGNPGAAYGRTRHSVGFMVLDRFAELNNATAWREKDKSEQSEIVINNMKILLIKPQTYMNNSGQALVHLGKAGIKAENIMVIHDELEKPFGTVSIKQGGSAHGHNGLRSVIATIGDQFWRVRVGIGRPTNKEDVGSYVLETFSEKRELVEHMIEHACQEIRQALE
ncbi:MAG: Peptidyl-tRNA hydrolase [candidate division TM6 bacterium GW2011_GWE2_41_16]|nr:MAG: Peptidyl-tRNA hydrolase [candidate division TM6 bacterium GW2011_GWE2_41_16]